MQCCNCEDELKWICDETDEDMDGRMVIQTYLICESCGTQVNIITPSRDNGVE